MKAAIAAILLYGCAVPPHPNSVEGIKAEARREYAARLEAKCIELNMWPKDRPPGTVIYNARMEHPYFYCRQRAIQMAARAVK